MAPTSSANACRKKDKNKKNDSNTEPDGEEEFIDSLEEDAEDNDGEAEQKAKFIEKADPKTPLEVAQREAIKKQEMQITRLRNEIKKLKAFISKRKQTYKRKRKDNQAPTRALSAYNIFVQGRFSKLASENEAALQSDDTNAQLKRVPPASLVASTGSEWKNLPPEEKVQYAAL